MKFDAVVIGTGQAGPALARDLVRHGHKTAIIENGKFGGTCVNTGCTPTKAYIASARRAYVARNSQDHGVFAADLKVDLKVIKKRKDELVTASRTGLENLLKETDNLVVFEGRGVLAGPDSVEVNGQRITADRIFINVGGKPRIPDGFEQVKYLTSDTILDLETLPEHLVIVGGGYVGLEFGQMFRRFGSKVTIIEKGDRLLKKEDPEVGKAILEVFHQENIQVRLNAECMSGSFRNGEVVVDINCTEGEPEVRGSHLLIATGRVPSTRELGLEKAGVEIDDRGFIKVNEHLQTTIPNIWAMGDCNGEGAFTHTAYNDYQIVSSQLFGDSGRKLSDRFPCYAAFIDPPFARVGLNETEIKEKHLPALVAQMPMSKIARAKEKGETMGFLKVFIDAQTDKILGATFIGTGADEAIHAIIDMMYAGAPYTTIRDAVHIHPTVSELIPTLLENPEPL